jgi:hypothetical protein
MGEHRYEPHRRKPAEYLVSLNLDILKRGNELTFVISNRKEVIDFTQGTNHIGNLVRNWHVCF